MSLDAKDSFKEWQKDPKYAEAYAGMAAEFELAAQLIKTRKRAKLTQADVAKRMGTDRRQIIRIESGGENVTYSSLQRYAAALGKKLQIRLV